ncbi:hypothetical protein CC78DRAFT_532940 [Lojkania enalia]|uniref:BZIP domain-containing protein n=1 Tax=Lojkania enalia TaxID=147567 RepID=A0A9P4KAQ2_9PLEO|nr:hypothetical protein CC78DRAFT_532940 [Didymosphaeria enalia]
MPMRKRRIPFDSGLTEEELKAEQKKRNKESAAKSREYKNKRINQLEGENRGLKQEIHARDYEIISLRRQLDALKAHQNTAIPPCSSQASQHGPVFHSVLRPKAQGFSVPFMLLQGPSDFPGFDNQFQRGPPNVPQAIPPLHMSPNMLQAISPPLQFKKYVPEALNSHFQMQPMVEAADLSLPTLPDGPKAVNHYFQQVEEPPARILNTPTQDQEVELDWELFTQGAEWYEVQSNANR